MSDPTVYPEPVEGTPATVPPPGSRPDAPPPSEDSLQQRERNLRGRAGTFEQRLERLEAIVLDGAPVPEKPLATDPYEFAPVVEPAPTAEEVQAYESPPDYTPPKKKGRSDS